MGHPQGQRPVHPSRLGNGKSKPQPFENRKESATRNFKFKGCATRQN